ncbi:unnamed protein product [Polarella glacialis]|uniref:Uncharacterized protein n=1 Tax=Polarella glacialis TaxID=89957 RepID=A0A813KWL5_POLGL|nr:unnamed protein product [Polarella glacialis]
MDRSLSEEEAGLQLRDQRGAEVDPQLEFPVAKTGPLADGKPVLLPEASDLPSVASKGASGSGEQVLESPPAKAGNSSAKAEAEEIEDSPPPRRGRSRGQKVRSPSQKERDASPSGEKRRKKEKRKRSRSASSSTSSRTRRHRRKASKKADALLSRTPEPLPSGDVASPAKVNSQAASPSNSRDDQILEFSSKISSLVLMSVPEDCAAVAARIVDSGIRSVSTFRLFANVDNLVARILPSPAHFNEEILLREIVEAVVAAEKKGPDPSLELPGHPNLMSPDTNSELAKAIRMMSRDGKPRKKDGVRGPGHPSDSEDEPLFDLSSALNSFGVQVLPVHWFGDTKRLELLRKHFEKAKAAGTPWPHFIASSTFEEWIPPWVGAGSSPDEKTKKLREWKSNSSGSSPSQAYGMIASFWLSHAALAIVDFRDVVSHMLCLFKMHSEFGMDFSISYERRLADHIQHNLRSHVFLDMPVLLANPVPSIMSELQLSSRRTKNFVPRTADLTEASVKGDGKGKARNKQTTDPLPPSGSPPNVVKETPATRHEPEKGKPLNVVGTEKRAGVCFKEDTANKIFCPLKDSCPKVHLDTKLPADAERFNRAKTSWQAKKTPPVTAS